MRHFIQNTAMVTTAIALLPSPASALDIDSRVAIDNLRGRIEKLGANRAESRDNF